MKAGELDRMVQFQRMVATTDSLNAEINTWENVGGRKHARYRAVDGNTVQIANQLQPGTTAELLVRVGGVRPEMKTWRALMGDQTLYVEAVLPEGKTGYRLLVSEGLRDA